jgi:hypothetical protein
LGAKFELGVGADEAE